MSDLRERAVQALLDRRGLAGLFGRPEAEGDVAAIEAVGLRIADARESTVCPRCEALDDALSTEGARIFRGRAGGIMVVTSEADPDIVASMCADAVELVPRQTDEPAGDGEAFCTSALVPGVFECQDIETGAPRPLGHTLPHTARGSSGSRVTWSDEEGTAP
jgi:hypothetical protein